MFSCENDRGTLGVSSIVQCIILPPRNKSLPRNPFEFLHIRESLVSRTSRLDPRDSRLDPRTFRASRLEDRVSSFECQLTFERYCTLNKSPEEIDTVIVKIVNEKETGIVFNLKYEV